jgi:ADP-ribose pyrophosphatase YjhB (NUDIX family)
MEELPTPPQLSGTTTQQVYCCNVHGNLVPFPRTHLKFSPAVYGILIENNRALLQMEPVSRLFFPPGGRVSAEQTTAQAVRQHFRAATGITPEVGHVLLIQDEYRVDENNQPWHLAVMYFSLTRPTAGRSSLVDFDNPAKPEWISLDHLTRPQLFFGYDAIQVAHKQTP